MKKQIAVILSTILLLTACTQPTPSSSTPIVTSDTTVSTSQPADTATPSSSSLSSSEEEKSPEDMKLDEYLKNNTATANIENIAEMFQLIDVEQYDIILAGENDHTIANNYLFRYELLTYLNKNYGYRYILEEGGMASSLYMNQYLKTGDEAILKRSIQNKRGSMSYCVENMEFYKKLYAYNKGLPEDKKIVLIGSDVEHQINTSAVYLNSILPNAAPPAILAEQIAFLKIQEYWDMQIENKNTVAVKFHELFQHMEGNKQSYQSYLGSKFEEFSFIVGNVEAWYQSAVAPTDASRREIREQKIYENFMEIYSKLKGEKLFGQWGDGHIYQEKGFIGHPTSFLTRALHYDNVPKERICSIQILYQTSRIVADTKSTYHNINGKDGPYTSLGMKKRGGKNILPFVTQNYGLAKLTGKDSPYATNTYILSSDLTGATTDRFQYVAVIKNSPAITFLEPVS